MKVKPSAKPRASFGKLFQAKRALEKASESKEKAEKEFIELLKQSAHLSGRIATYNKHRYYVTISSNQDLWHRPSLKLQKVQE